MSKTLKILLGIGGGLLLLIFIFVSYFVGKYNTMVNLDEEVQTAWSQVENQYQRRSDLIPNLVNTVKGFASHEKETLEAVTNARASASQTKVDIKDAQSFSQFQASQGELSSALSRLLVTVEAYPDLKANQNFLDLQAQLEGTENRISTERKRYNDTAKPYNKFIRKFPNNFISGIFGFERAQLFEAQNGAETTPAVSFE